MNSFTQDERRKFPRFSDKILGHARVEIIPCPPLFGDPATGYLIDMSAGGMGIVLGELIPRNVFLKMRMVLPDDFSVESVIKVRRVIQHGRSHAYLHGIEFLNPSPEMTTHLETLAHDILSCNERIDSQQKEVCLDSCSLRKLCKRQQCIEKNVRPALITLTNEAKKASDWDTYKSHMQQQFKKAA